MWTQKIDSTFWEDKIFLEANYTEPLQGDKVNRNNYIKTNLQFNSSTFLFSTTTTTTKAGAESTFFFFFNRLALTGLFLPWPCPYASTVFPLAPSE